MLAGAAMMNVGVDKVGIRTLCGIFKNVYMYICSWEILCPSLSHIIHLTATGILKSPLCFHQMAEENKNLQSIANESEKRADVEKTGLLDETEYDD